MSAPAARVSLRWGAASDVGQVRQVNEDSMLVGPGVFVVADGMGGHAAGEVASRLAVETIESELDGTAPESEVPRRTLDLVTAVQAANDRVWSASENDPNLAGMGTTVVAIGLVEEDGEARLAIVNVGDSRAYRLSGGDLDQVSDDHSLVGELHREGRITADEARHHPQKNIVTRAIGLEQFVDVDEFQVLPRTGDRYLLCSDGLTDEVDERDIATVLRTIDDPDDAARELVRRANEHGGRDNITIVVVDVVDDGLDPAAASADARRESIPDHEDFTHHADQDTESLMAVPDDRAHLQRGTTTAAPPSPPPVAPPAPDEDDGPRPPRAVTVRSLAFVLAVVALLGAGGFLAYRYVQDTYHVGILEDEVVIFQGRPGGVLWFDPSFEEGTGIEVDDVPPAVLEDLEGGVSQPTLERARRYVANLEERIEDTKPPVTTTTTRPRTTTTSTTQPGGTQPTSTTTAGAGAG
ncbi:MAG TPA: Stp1/IreP family PP2C-type Ser/Thr phosphatase [Acidimicrobiales bacterium]|nr:Stp1/IreP family PP2C-type Ser/Thr phosphatase [Acidimicrobiales bacterium]